MADNGHENAKAYQVAQRAMADLKTAVYAVLANASAEGLRNVDIGHALGIYSGHVGHEGHIPRTVLAILEAEGVVVQDQKTKRWKLRVPSETDGEEDAV